MKRNAIRTLQRIISINAVLLLIFGLAGLWLCAAPANADPISGHGPIPDMTLKVGESAKTQNVSSYFKAGNDDQQWWLSGVTPGDSNVATAGYSGKDVTVTPVAVGSTSIGITAKSSGNNELTLYMKVKVRPDNSPPDFDSSATQSVAENSTTVVTVQASDYDSQDSITGYLITGGDDRGKFSIVQSTGVLTFSSAPDFENPDSDADTNVYKVTVEATSGAISEKRRLTATQDITVTVTNVNEAPTTVGSISAVTISVDGDDESVDVSSNFSDPDANTTLTYTASSSDTAKATVSVASSTVTVTPEAAGSAKITVTASDGSLTASKTFTVTVKANTAPTFTTLASVTAAENQTAVITVKASDGESEDTIGDFSISGGDDEDEFSITTGGVLTFDDAPDFEAKGSADDSNDYEVIVKVKSGTGDREKEATQTITVTVTDVNETPVAKDSISAVTISVDGNDEDVDVSSKFEDPDDDTLTYTVSSSDTAKATVSVSSSTVTISPEAAGTATITVTASDGSFSATQDISVTVKANTAPTFTSSARVDVKENTTTVVTVTATDSETEDTIGDYSIKTDTGSGADHGKFSVTTGGILTFSSAPDFETPDSAANPKSNVYKVTVEAQSGSGDRNKKATQDITVTVTNVNETPKAEGTISAVTLNVGGKDGLVDVSSKFSDPDGDDLTYTVSSDKTSVATATRSAVKDHVIVIKPVSAGSATVTVTAGDRGLNDDARLIATQTISVTVKANSAPTFDSSATASVAENSTTVTTVSADDSDSDDSVTGYSITSGADKDKFSITTGGALSFSSAPNFEDPDSDADSNVYKVTVEVKSGTGDREKKATQDITVTVTDVNETPVAKDTISAVTLNQDGNTDSVDVSGKFSDPDANDTLTYTASSSKASVATVSVSDSTVTITPKAGGAATITVTATDSGNETATQTISVTVKANTAPTFSSSATASVAENNTAVVTVTATDSESEDDIGDYSIKTVTGSGADHGKFSITTGGALTFSSAPDFEDPDSDADSNEYKVTVEVESGADDRKRTATQDITVTVTDVNERPEKVGSISAVTLNQDGNTDSVDVSSKFSDPDGDTLSYTAASDKASVATAAVSSSTVTVTPKAAGKATVTVTASDDGDLSVKQMFIVTVKANADPTFSSSASVKVAENTTTVVTVTATDSETEDNVTGYTISGGADSGKFSIVASSGDLSFSSAPNFESPGSSNSSNVYAVTVQVSSGSDDRVRTATQDITVTVTDVNETPEAVDTISAVTLNQDGNSDSVDVSSKFSDPDAGDTLTYTASSDKTSVATASVSSSTVTITPKAAGTATITVTATDSGSETATQDISVTVKKNTVPTFTSKASVDVAENSTTVVKVTASDSDDGDSVTGYSISGGADSGKFSIVASSGALSFSSAPNFESPGSANSTNVYAVTVRVSSGGGDRVRTADQAITVTVTDVNETPEAVGTISAVTLNELGDAGSVDVSSAFTDPDSNTTLTYTASSGDSSVATASVSSSTVTITPAADGTATITVTASDGSLKATQDISVTVKENTAPTFGNSASVRVSENTTDVVTLTADDSESEDAIGDYSITGGADKGKFSIVASTGALSFSSAPNYESPGSAKGSNVYAVTVGVSSGGGDRVRTATQNLTVTVTDVNETPQPIGEVSGSTVNQDGNSSQVDVASNFSDPDRDTLRYSALSSAASVATASASGSTVTIAPVAPGNATITVIASDGSLSATQDISVTVKPNSAPTFGSSSSVNVAENTTSVIAVSASDREDGINGYSISGGADSAKFSIGSSSGDLSFSSAPNFENPGSANGTNVYAVTVRVSSGSGDRLKSAAQDISVTVTDVNETPEAVGSISEVTLNEDGNSDSVDASSYFADPDGDTLSYTASSSATSVATASVSGSSVTIAPVAAGGAIVTVTASDGGLSATQTFVVTVLANTGPAFGSSANLSVPENTTAVITLTAVDSEDSINGYSISGGADSGQFTINTSSGVLSFNTAPNYESPADASGNNNYIVEVQASSGGGDRVKTATQTLTVPVTDVNETPEAVGSISEVTLNEDGNSDSVDASSYFADPDGDTLSYTASSSAASVATASVSSSSVTVAPVSAGSAIVTVTASDGSLSATQTIAVTVMANTAPAFGSAANLSVAENTTAVTTLTAADSEDSINGYSISGGADSGQFTINTSSGVLSFNTAPNYESPADASGNNNYIVEVQASSGGGDRVKTATQTLTVPVTDVNETPEAAGTISAMTLNEDGNSDSVDASSYFTDPDGDTLSYTASSSAASVATASVSDSTITISPVAAGSATVTVTASDPDGLTATQTIAVTVMANTAPTFNSASSVSIAENTTTVITVTAADGDNGDSVTGYSISAGGGSDSAKFSIGSSSGALSFNTAPNYESPADASGNNNYIVEVQASSGGGDRVKTATQTLTVTVTDVNEAPEAVGAISAVTVNEDGNSDLVDASSNFSDPDGDTLSYTASSSAASVATASVSGSTITISPVAAGSATVTVTASDPDGLTATQTIGVTVMANTAPTFSGSASVSVAENATAVTTLTASDSEDSINGYSISGGADSGQFTINTSSGALNFSSAPNYESPADASGNNNYIVEAQVSSGSGDRVKTATQTLTVIVTDVNEAPLSTGSISAITLNVDGAAWLNDVSADFSDPDGDALSYAASSSQTAVATVSVSGSSVTVSPVAAGNGTVTVTATDPGGLSATRTIAVEVKANNTSRFIGVTAFSVPENTLAVGTVTATDNDDTITGYSISGGADRAKFSIVSSSGALSFNAAPNFENPDSSDNTNEYDVIVGVASGAGDRAKTASQPLTVTVTDVNEAPEASGSISAVTLNVGGNSRTVDVSGDFTDPDGDALTYTASSNEISIAAASVSGSIVRLTPVAAGSATVTVTANDGSLSAVQTIAVTVMANSAPAFSSAASFSIPENTIVVGAVTATDSDSGDSITGYSIIGGADSGQFTIDGSSGVLSFNAAPNYEAPTDASGNNDYIVEVQASSGGGDRAKTATQTITVTVTDVNEAPQASGSISSVTLNVDGNSRSVDVSGNFTDPDGDALSYVASSSAASVATASVSGSSVTIAPVTAGSATVTVTASDPDGLSAGQTIAVTVMANSAPTFSNSASVSVAENTTAVTTLTATDSEDSVNGYSITGGADRGQFTINTSSGALSFNSAPNYEAPADASGNNDYIVEVRVSSGGGDREKTATQILTVTVTDVNEAPVAAGSVSGIVLNAGGNAAVIQVSTNFSDPDGDTLTYSATSSNASVATAAVSDATLTVTPLVAGSTTVTLSATDPGGLSATQTISVTVAPNDASRFISVTAFSVPENTTAVGTVTATDNDDTITGYSISGGADSNAFSIDSTSGALGFNTAPNYEAPTDASGNNDYIVEVQVSSGSGDRAKTASQTLTVTVTDVNEAPIAAGSIAGVSLNPGGNAADIDVSGAFTDPDGDALTYSASSSEASVAVANVLNSTVTVTPAAAGSATVTVTASDPDGLSAKQTIAVIVTPNRLPTFSGPFGFSVPENTTAVGTVTAADSDSGDSVTGYAISGGADDANFSVDSISGALSFNTAPNYEAPADASGNNDYVVEIQASGGSGDRARSATQTFTVTVTDVNEAPIAIGAISGVAVYVNGNSRSVDAASYFTDPDGDALSYTASSSRTGAATASVSGSTVTITPVAAGSATVTVTASDPDGLTATQTIAVRTLAAQNRAPVAVGSINAVKLVVNGASRTVDVSSKFRDPDGDSLSFTAASSNTAQASASVSGSSVTISPVAVGGATITVTASDGGLRATQTIAVTVAPAANQPPTAQKPTNPVTLVNDGSSVTVDVSDNFSDPDGGDLTYTAVSSDTGVATLSVSGDEITIVVAGEGTATITVTATDSSGSEVSQTFGVTVNPAPNTAPVATDAIAAITLVMGQSSKTVDVSGNFSDPEGDDLTYTAVSTDNAVATVEVTGDRITVTPKSVESTTLTVMASDGELTASQTVQVKVEPPPNRAPVVDGQIGAITMQDGETPHTVDLSEKFSDPDSDSLTYTAESSDTGVVTAVVSEGALTITPAGVGATTITVTATDGNGLAITQTFAVTVEPPPNQSPVVKSPIGSVTLQDGEASETVDLSAKYSDPDGDDLTYTAVSSDTGVATAVVSGGTLTIAPAGVGATTITVTASDADGLTTTQTFTITVEESPIRGPVKAGPVGSITLTPERPSVTLNGTSHFSDPNGGVLSFTAASSDTGAAAVRVYGDLITVSSVDPGATTVTVTATDSKGLTAAIEINVTVLGANLIQYRTELLPNYPSPFNPETWIPYRLGEDADVTVTVYDATGRAVRTFAIGYREAGAYVSRDKAVYWDGRNDIGEPVAAGVYFYHLATANYSRTRETSIIK